MKYFFAILSLVLCSIILSFCIGAFYSYNYPMKYKDVINDCAKTYNVENAVIASVANVESNFKENAKSNKGAIGIMQIMPSTAEWIAKKNGIDYSEEKLYQAEYNIKIGSCYLAYLITYFNDKDLGLCAYNAGQGNVSLWLKDERYSKDGKTLSKIPFKETENYLKKISKNYNYYKNKYK